MTQLTVLVDVLLWSVVCLHWVDLTFLVPSSDWHLERNEAICIVNGKGLGPHIHATKNAATRLALATFLSDMKPRQKIAGGMLFV